MSAQSSKIRFEDLIEMHSTLSSDVFSGMRGHYPIAASDMEVTIATLLALDLAPDKTLVCDCGAGAGVAMAQLNRLGYRTVGIERSRRLRQNAMEFKAMLQRNRLLTPVTMDFRQGSYFPQEYLELREKGSAIAPKYEWQPPFMEAEGVVRLFTEGNSASRK